MKEVARTQWEVLPEGLFVFYGGPGTFAEGDYRRWYQDLTTRGIKKYLGGTAKGFTISGEQRRHGRDFFKDHRICFVTITDDPIVRGFVTTGSWFGLDIAAFGWSNLDAAMLRLGLDASAGERAQNTLLRLRAAVTCKMTLAPTG